MIPSRTPDDRTRRRGIHSVPRYDGPPVIDLDAMLAEPGAASIRQRHRFAVALGHLSADEWGAASRCEGWSVQDVVEHLIGVGRYWVHSIGSGLRGEPSRLLLEFDPVAVPAAMVAAARGADPLDTLARFASANEELDRLVGSLGTSDWSCLAEAPPGHLAIRAVVAHGLWDAWVHERDVLLPLAGEPVVEPDEVTVALAYVAALGPALDRLAGSRRSGTIAFVARDPDVRFSIEAGEQVRVLPATDAAPTPSEGTVTGCAVDLVEALSYRIPMVPLADEQRWMIGSLGRLFGRDR